MEHALYYASRIGTSIDQVTEEDNMRANVAACQVVVDFLQHALEFVETSVNIADRVNAQAIGNGISPLALTPSSKSAQNGAKHVVFKAS